MVRCMQAQCALKLPHRSVQTHLYNMSTIRMLFRIYDDNPCTTLLLCFALSVEGPKENLAVITATPGWQEWLLELLLDGSPCLAPHPPPSSPSPPHRQPRPSSASSDGVPRADNAAHSPWEWAGREGQVIRALLRALHGHCVQQQPQGWIALEQTACHLRCCTSVTIPHTFFATPH